MPWIQVARMEDCPPGRSLEAVARDRIVALYNVEGEIFALDGVCPHQGGPLGKGVLSTHSAGTCVVTCPWHGWQFDVRSGQSQLSARIIQPRFETRVENGAILVNLDEPT